MKSNYGKGYSQATLLGKRRSLHERVNMISVAEKRAKLQVAKNLLDILDDEQ